VSFSPEALIARLAELEQQLAAPGRYVIAMSGGLDSTVLANALAAARTEHGKALLIIHIDHGLHAASASWAEHCQAVAKQLGIEFLLEHVDVDVSTGTGTEAAARQARYAALAGHMTSSDWCLSAHHQDDQGETLLLNLLRGSGPAGLSGMRPLRRLGAGWLVRPLLDVPRQALLDYANSAKLAWIDDPGNEEERFDRNFLRKRVVPVFEERWPHAARKFSRSAELAGDASDLLADLADLDLDTMGATVDRLPLKGLGALPRNRQNNVLRRAARLTGLPTPAAAHLQAIQSELLVARDDAMPLVSWPGGEARRYREHVYLLPALDDVSFEDGQALDELGQVIGPGLGSVRLARGGGPGLSDALLQAGLTIRRRRGGEKIKLSGQQHTRKLKKLLQEEHVVPWWRDRLPLVYAGDELVAVADLWLADSACTSPGAVIHWDERPNLY
jgi:tRNA(Ile)-lysidine synthase